MKIQFLQDWRNFAKGEIVETIPEGSAELLIQRKIAKAFIPPPPTVSEAAANVVRKVITRTKAK